MFYNYFANIIHGGFTMSSYLEEGKKYLENGDYEIAISFFNKCLDDENERVDALLKKAEALKKMGDVEASKKCYDEALGEDNSTRDNKYGGISVNNELFSDDNYKEAINLLGLAFPSNADSCFEKALNEDSNTDPDYWLAKSGEFHEIKGEWADKCFDNFLKFNQNNDSDYWLLKAHELGAIDNQWASKCLEHAKKLHDD